MVQAHTRCLARVRSCVKHPAPNLARAPPPHPSLAPTSPVSASWMPPWLLSSGVLHAKPLLPAQCWGLLPGCWQGPCRRERGAGLPLSCFVSGQSHSTRVGGGSCALGYCSFTSLHPMFTLSSPWREGLALESWFS